MIYDTLDNNKTKTRLKTQRLKTQRLRKLFEEGSLKITASQNSLGYIATNNFRGNYSFLNLKIVANSNSCRKFQFFA